MLARLMELQYLLLNSFAMLCWLVEIIEEIILLRIKVYPLPCPAMSDLHPRE